MSGNRKAHVVCFVRFIIGVVLYSLAILAKGFWLHSMERTLWRFIVMLLPMTGVRVYAQTMRETLQKIDEVQQKKVLDVLITLPTGTTLTYIAYSFMEKVGLPLLNVPWIATIQGVFFIIGTL